MKLLRFTYLLSLICISSYSQSISDYPIIEAGDFINSYAIVKIKTPEGIKSNIISKKGILSISKHSKYDIDTLAFPLYCIKSDSGKCIIDMKGNKIGKWTQTNPKTLKNSKHKITIIVLGQYSYFFDSNHKLIKSLELNVTNIEDDFFIANTANSFYTKYAFNYNFQKIIKYTISSYEYNSTNKLIKFKTTDDQTGINKTDGTVIVPLMPNIELYDYEYITKDASNRYKLFDTNGKLLYSSQKNMPIYNTHKGEYTIKIKEKQWTYWEKGNKIFHDSISENLIEKWSSDLYRIYKNNLVGVIQQNTIEIIPPIFKWIRYCNEAKIFEAHRNDSSFFYNTSGQILLAGPSKASISADLNCFGNSFNYLIDRQQNKLANNKGQLLSLDTFKYTYSQSNYLIAVNENQSLVFNKNGKLLFSFDTKCKFYNQNGSIENKDSAEYIVFINKNKLNLINAKHEIIFHDTLVNFQEYAYQRPKHLLVFKTKDGDFKTFNLKTSHFLKFQNYELVNSYEDKYFIVKNAKNEQLLLDTNNNELIRAEEIYPLGNNLFKILLKTTVISIDGSIRKTAKIYDAKKEKYLINTEFAYINNQSEGAIAVMGSKNRWEYLDTEGNYLFAQSLNSNQMQPYNQEATDKKGN